MWDVANGQVERVMAGHTDVVNALSWHHLPGAKRSARIASGSSDKTVRVWDVQDGKPLLILDGHRSPVLNVQWLRQGTLLASTSLDGSLIVWDPANGTPLFRRDGPGHPWLGSRCRLLVPSKQSGLRNIGGTLLFHTFDVDTTKQRIATATSKSAKIVLLGESGTGKSTLAYYLAKNEFSDQLSTVGMEIWSIPPDQLSPEELPPGEEREVLVWDLGGQDYYQMVHQLFLEDTRIALFFLDATRGAGQLDDIQIWNERLEVQLGKKGRPCRKVLLRTKMDLVVGQTLDDPRLANVMRDCGIEVCLSISVKQPEHDANMAKLKSTLNQVIAWQEFPPITQLKLFHDVRTAIRTSRDEGRLFLPIAELQARFVGCEYFDETDFNEAITRLSEQGEVVDFMDNLNGRRLILRIKEIVRIAGSIIQRAATNLRGIPAVSREDIFGTALLDDVKHLEPTDRRDILEAVISMLASHELCFLSQGLLVFPSAARLEVSGQDTGLEAGSSQRFHASGDLRKLYSALVLHLRRLRSYGEVRLWRNLARFEQEESICAIRVDEKAFFHLEVLFSSNCAVETQDSFKKAVHTIAGLEGVRLTKESEIRCSQCKLQYFDAQVASMLKRGRKNFECLNCGSTIRLPASSYAARGSDSITIENRRREVSVEDQLSHAPGTLKATSADVIRLLHLSDLHVTQEDTPEKLLAPLNLDRMPKIDYLVISGDISDRGEARGFERAFEVINQLLTDLHLSSEKLILCPGNHDVDETVLVYDLKRANDAKNAGITDLEATLDPGIVRVRRPDAEYQKRFDRFRAVYHKLTQFDYPLEAGRQARDLLYENDKIQFIVLNSAWQIDEYHRKRATLNEQARSLALLNADKTVEKALAENKLLIGDRVIRIAVWHHAVTGDNKMVGIEPFIDSLFDRDFCLCLHGDVHELRAETYSPFGRKLHIVGAGSFHARYEDRPPNTSNYYNLIEISRDLQRCRVNVKQQKRIGGPFEAAYDFRDDTGNSQDHFVFEPRVYTVPGSPD
jgi:signal recognition particle receptor subunit beta